MRKALIVDDEQKIRRLYKEYLAAEDFEVLEAENGEQASLTLIREQNIDLVLLDIRMPIVSGAVLFDIIKLNNPNAKVLVSSVYPLEDQRRVIRGADGYFDKSEGPEVLMMRINRVLSITPKGEGG